MTHRLSTACLLATGLIGLSACGSQPAEGPKEQIIVAQPGEAETPASEPMAGEAADTEADTQ